MYDTCVYIIVCKFKTYPDITYCSMYFGRVYIFCTICNLHIAMSELKVHRMPDNLQIGTIWRLCNTTMPTVEPQL